MSRRRRVHHLLEKPTVLSADVETRTAALADVAHAHIARLIDDVEDGRRAALDEILRLGTRRSTFEKQVPLRRNVLNGNLAAHVDILEFGGPGRTNEDERRGQPAGWEPGAAGGHRGFKQDILAVGAERRVAVNAHFPRERYPQRRLRALIEPLPLDFLHAGVLEPPLHPVHRPLPRLQPRHPSPELPRSDLMRLAAPTGETNDRLEIAMDGVTSQRGETFFAGRDGCRPWAVVVSENHRRRIRLKSGRELHAKPHVLVRRLPRSACVLRSERCAMGDGCDDNQRDNGSSGGTVHFHRELSPCRARTIVTTDRLTATAQKCPRASPVTNLLCDNRPIEATAFVRKDR